MPPLLVIFFAALLVFFAPPPAHARGDRIIVLDPGHGGADPGAVFHGVQEKNITIKTAKALQKAISRQQRLSRFSDARRRSLPHAQ